jgi:hypothetical protein
MCDITNTQKLPSTNIEDEIKQTLQEKNEEMKKSPNNEYSTIGRFKIYTIQSNS